MSSKIDAAFRTDINGLRAWAVMGVVLYHFGVPGFSGGFVGVDVFFVISGFLMTSIMSVSSVHRLIKILGFSAQKPLYRAWQQDPVLVRTWETKTHPRDPRRSQAGRGNDLLWRRVGYPLGLPEWHHLGAAGPDAGDSGDGPALLAEHDLGGQHAGKFRFMLHEGSVGAKVFVEFFKRLMVNAEEPVFLIVDGHPIHKTTTVKSYVEGLGGKLKLFYLPPYSPHLNPDEAGWTHTRGKVSRQLVESAKEMKWLAYGAATMLHSRAVALKQSYV
jgi:transposase